MNETEINQSDKKKKSIKTLIGVAVGLVTMVLVQHYFFAPPSFDKVMMQMVSEINKTCPIMVDKETQFDNAIALPDRVLLYNYTLVNLNKAEINPDTVKKYIEPGIINTVKTNPDMKTLRENKTTFIYNYKDKTGLFVLKITVTPAMY